MKVEKGSAGDGMLMMSLTRARSGVGTSQQTAQIAEKMQLWLFEEDCRQIGKERLSGQLQQHDNAPASVCKTAELR